jgi:hypothetical protein
VSEIAPVPPAAPGLDQPALLRHLRRLGACPDAVIWAKTQPDPETLWAACERGDWMLWLAARTGVRRQDLVLAACACARLALPYVAVGEPRPLRAIETAERWARGEGASLVDVRTAAYAARAAAADAAYAADAAADAAYAAAADADAADAAGAKVLRECAGLVRARIPWATVAAALETP